MRIRQINKSVSELIQGAEWLGEGASKEAFGKGNIVYKVPRGRYLLEEGGFGTNLPYPDTIEEMNEFLAIVQDYEESLVWPLGQLAMEIIVWEALKELKEEGYDISGFAEIKDYYLDKNGVLVIEQERCEDFRGCDSYDFEKLREELEIVGKKLIEDYNIELKDIREGNCAYSDEGNGKLKIFDFGLSSSTDIFAYDGYSCCDESYKSY